MDTKSKYLTQQQLAVELGITTRRVRQLIEAHILPEPEERLYDFAICRERYDLIRNKQDRARWDGFYRGVEQAARETEKLVELALDPTSTVSQIREASISVQSLFSNLRFCTGARTRSDAEKKFIFGLWREKENAILGALVAHASALVTRGEGLQASPAG